MLAVLHAVLGGWVNKSGYAHQTEVTLLQGIEPAIIQLGEVHSQRLVNLQWLPCNQRRAPGGAALGPEKPPAQGGVESGGVKQQPWIGLPACAAYARRSARKRVQ